jgi:hypothetical protein
MKNKHKVSYLGKDGKMHDYEIEKFTLLPPEPKDIKFEETDSGMKWSTTMMFHTATFKLEKGNKIFMGIDLANDGSLSSVSTIEPNNENRTSEEMNF